MKDRVETGAAGIRDLGQYIRDQRRVSDVSLRQLASLAGVSNPYLSQIERGLRRPSAEILQQIAKALRISAEALYVQAGILEQREGDGKVADALLADDGLTERQKQVLLEIYDSFRKENGPLVPEAPAPVLVPDEPVRTARPPRTRASTTAKTSTAKTRTAKTRTAEASPTTTPTPDEPQEARA